MKKTILNLALILFAVCAFAQAPDWQWATQAGGSNIDNGYEIAIDDNGNSYVTGWFWNTATFGSYSLTGSGVYDIFVAKMDANGNWLWVTKADGISSDSGLGIAIDDNSNSYLTGSFMDTATFGSYSLTSSGDSDIFVAKMDANGNWLWATHAGGSGIDTGQVIAIDDNGNSYLTGYFSTTATFGFYSITSSGYFDIFAAKMDANGNWLWAVQAGGIAYDYGLGIAIDDNENSYLTGMFSFSATFGSYSLTSSGEYDSEIFVAKMDTNGNWLWATQAGGSSDEWSMAIVLDSYSNSYVTGSFWDTATFGSYSLTSNGQDDIYVAKMDANGNWLWAVQAGGNSSDQGYGITIDDNGNSYVTGSFSYNATFGSYPFINCGGSDIFVAKLGNDASVENEIVPTKMELSNYPNPFNPETNIVFNLPEAGEVQLDIYSIKGQKIKSLLNDQIVAGEHSIVWNGVDFTGKKVSSGIYFYKLITPSATHTKKMLLLK